MPLKSIGYPVMVSNTTTNMVSDRDATLSNLILALGTARGSLLCDPNFGTDILRRMFAQNEPVLKELVIDDIYTAILQYLPQIMVKREDITIVQSGVDIFVNIKATNMLSITPDVYDINLSQVFGE